MSHSRAPGGSALGAGAESARLAREARELDGRDWSSSGVRAVPAADSLRSFAAELAGPLGTPYEGGVWKLTVALPAAGAAAHGGAGAGAARAKNSRRR
jgi:hypothetical protein